MIVGRVHDNLPRLSMQLDSLTGPIDIEFVFDTGFDGELSMPFSLIRRLPARELGPSSRALADGSIKKVPVFEIDMEWNGEPRMVEVLCLERRPLMGTVLPEGWRLYVELSEGGEVVLEPPD